MDRPCIIDLFCGSGGFSYGFKKAGFEITLGIDNDKSKLKTFRRNITESTLDRDITKITKEDISTTINIDNIIGIIGSPPCVDYSSSNPNKIAKKEESNTSYFPLAYYYYKILTYIKPNFFVLENVKQFYYTRDLFILKKLFEFLGYNVSCNIINTKYFGIPQSRERLFIIGTLFKNDIDLYSLKNNNFISLKQAIGDLETLDPLLQYNLLPQVLSNDFNFSEYQQKMHSSNLQIFNHIMPYHSLKTINILKTLKSGELYNNKKLRSNSSDVSRTIGSKFSTPSGDGETMHYTSPRCLTLREAARIQSFDDNFIFETECLTKTQINKLVADAVPPLIAEVIAHELLNFI